MELKKFKVEISNKEDYFTCMGEEDEIEEYCEENDLDYDDFEELQTNLNNKPDHFELTVPENEFQKFITYCKNEGEVVSQDSNFTTFNLTVDTDVKVLEFISDKLSSKYDLEVETFDLKLDSALV